MQSFDRIKDLSAPDKLKELMANIPSLRDLANFQLLEIEGVCQKLIGFDRSLIMARYCYLLLVKGLVGGVIHGVTLEGKPIKEVAEKVAELVSVTTTIAFYPNQSSAESCYADITDFLSINILYNKQLHWRKALDQFLLTIRDIDFQGLYQLTTVLGELADLQQVNSDGRCLLLTMTTIIDFYID